MVMGMRPGFAKGRHQLAVRGQHFQRHLEVHVLQGLDGRQARRNQPIGDAKGKKTQQRATQSKVKRIAGQT
jgi:hypothetical protein